MLIYSKTIRQFCQEKNSPKKKILPKTFVMLPKEIQWYLIFYDVFGFNSGTSKLSQSRGIVYCIEFIHILSAIFFTLTKFKFLFELYQLNGTISTVNESLQYSATLYTYWLIIMDSICCQSSHKRFWKLIQQIDEKFCSQSHLRFRTYLAKMIAFFLVNISVSANGTTRLLRHNIVYSYTLWAKICFLRMFYYIFCLKIVHFQLKNIDKELDKLILRKLNVAEHNRRLKWTRQYISIIDEMTNHLNKIFGWSNAAVIFCCFYYILTCLNWIFINYTRFSMEEFICEFRSNCQH